MSDVLEVQTKESTSSYSRKPNLFARVRILHITCNRGKMCVRVLKNVSVRACMRTSGNG